MSTPQLDRMREHCQRLRLYQIEQELSVYQIVATQATPHIHHKIKLKLQVTAQW